MAQIFIRTTEKNVEHPQILYEPTYSMEKKLNEITRNQWLYDNDIGI